MFLHDIVNPLTIEEAKAAKTRLDPHCWHNKKIGKPATKVKGGVRVNNCVPKESVNESEVDEVFGFQTTRPPVKKPTASLAQMRKEFEKDPATPPPKVVQSKDADEKRAQAVHVRHADEAVKNSHGHTKKQQAAIAMAKQGVAEGHADQQRKIFKKNGKPVGEVGIDRESSPGNGQWYMKCYAYDIDNAGYDSYEEAVEELKHCLKQGVAEAAPDPRYLQRHGREADQTWPDDSNSLSKRYNDRDSNRDIVVPNLAAVNAGTAPKNKHYQSTPFHPSGIKIATKIKPSITKTTVGRLDRPEVPNFLKKGVEEDNKPVHRIGLVVTDPNHPMVSKRNDTIQKTVRVPGNDREKAINSAIAHYRRKGFKVHDHHYLGLDGGVAEGYDEDDECDHCRGTGEGQFDGTSCSYCHGTGVARPDHNDDDENFNVPDDYYESGDAWTQGGDSTTFGDGSGNAWTGGNAGGSGPTTDLMGESDSRPYIRKVKHERPDGSIETTYELLDGNGRTIKTGMSKETAMSVLKHYRANYVKESTEQQRLAAMHRAGYFD